jgi:hypothetical protein
LTRNFLEEERSTTDFKKGIIKNNNIHGALSEPGRGTLGK